MDTLEPKTLIGSDTQTLAMPPEPGLGLGLEGSPFKVGDFVWGKFKDNQWWPGRIRDPLESTDSDPDQNSKLVVYFGMDSLSWCNLSQLKPFAGNIDKFVSSSNSKSFQAALDLAVSEFRKCSEAHLSSHSVRKEERLDFGPIGSNFSIQGFLDLVKDVALDVNVVDVLEIGMLKNGVVAYEKGLSVGHCRKTLFELAYKIDHDVFENADAPEENSSTNCSRVKMKNKKKVVSCNARTILDLEVENDSVGGVGKEEVVGSGRRERKKSKYLSPPYTYLSGEFAKSLSAKVVKCNTLGLDKEEEEEEISSASVPIDGFDIGELVSELEATAVNPLHLKGNHLGKVVRGFFAEFRRSVFCMSGKVCGENKTVVNCNTLGLDKEEEEISRALVLIDGLDVVELVSELEVMAVNPLHLKGNHLGEIVRGFFADYRRSVFCMSGKVYGKNKTVDKEVGDTWEEGEKAEGKVGRKRKDVVNIEGEVLTVKSEEGQKTFEVKRERKKKVVVNGEVSTPGDKSEVRMKTEGGEKIPIDKSEEGAKNEVEGEASNDMAEVGTTTEVEGKKVIDKSDEGKKAEVKRGRKRKVGLNGEGVTPVNLSNLTLEQSQLNNEAASKGNALNEVVNGKMPVALNFQTVMVSYDGSSGRKRGKKKSEASQHTAMRLGRETLNNVEIGSSNGRTIIDVPINMGSKITNDSGERKPRQRKNKKSKTNPQDPAALLLTFSPGNTVPSKEELISACGKYGLIIESETELLKESSSAKVVFVRSSDAEKAFNDKVAAIGSHVAGYRLRYLMGNLTSPSSLTPIPIPKPPLPCIRKSLEQMISSIGGVGMKSETSASLVGEMQGLLMKVDKLLTGPAAGTSA